MRVAALLLAIFTMTAHAQSGYLTYSTGIFPNGVTAADLNGDGKPDLAIANGGSSTLTILLNSGSGNFQSAPAVALASSFAPTSIGAADVNGDRKIDILAGGPGGLAVLLGNGDGTFQTPKLASGVPSPTSFQLADFNGDGIPDVAVTFLTLGFLIPTGASLQVFTGNGDGTFAPGPFFSLGLTPWAVVTIGDFNQDGVPDIAAASAQNVTVLLNDGKENFTGAANGNMPWNYAPGIATGDFNGDGKLDLAVSGQSDAQDGTGLGMITILLGNGKGTFQVEPSIPTSSVAQTVAVADLNGDGHADFAAGLNSPTFFAGRGDGTFGSGIPFGVTGNSGYLAIADFTGTGLPGFAATNQFFADPSLPTTGNVVILPRAVWPSLNFANVNAAGFGLGPLAPGSIVTGFGDWIIQPPFGAATGPPTTALDGDFVSVTGADGVSLLADLYYIAEQVNYVLPANAPSGLATVRVGSSGSVVAAGQIDIEPVAPGLFTVNANHLAAAYVTEVSPGGQQTTQPVYQTDASGNVTPVAIDLSTTDAVYLTIFGTGIRNNRAPIGAIATIGGMLDAQVTYAGPQGLYDGLDQVNILLPSGPASPLVSPSPYSTTLQLNFSGQPSNQVTLSIQ